MFVYFTVSAVVGMCVYLCVYKSVLMKLKEVLYGQSNISSS